MFTEDEEKVSEWKANKYYISDVKVSWVKLKLN